MSRILIVEDESDLRETLEYNLRQEGYEIHGTGLGQEGIRLARTVRPDLVLLDLMLPDVSGTEVCRSVKAADATRSIPVLILSAKGEEIDRVIGFELGADDYVTKPFSMRELLLRVRAVLRRKTEPGEPTASIDLDGLRIDRDAHRVWVHGLEIQLSLIEFKILVTLYDRRNRVQSRASLLDSIWGVEAGISERTVDAHVKRLRQKLGAARDYVETVRGVGYRFASAD